MSCGSPSSLALLEAKIIAEGMKEFLFLESRRRNDHGVQLLMSVNSRCYALTIMVPSGEAGQLDSQIA